MLILITFVVVWLVVHWLLQQPPAAAQRAA